MSTVCRIQAKVFKLSTREVKIAADGTFLVCCDPARDSCVAYPGALLCSQHSDPLSSLATESGMCLSDWWPPFFSTSISLVALSVCHAPPWRSCRHVASPPEHNIRSTLDVDLSWGKDEKDSLRARKRSVGKVKAWLDGGETS